MNIVGIPTQIRVVKFLITETGTYNPLFRRPYQTNMDPATLSAIQERVVSSNHITPQMLGGLADTFVMPSAAPELDSQGHSRQILIPQGWGERRLRFLLEVETTLSVGGTITEIVQGYTDYLGVTYNGVIDPKMEFHINSVLKIRKQMENTPFGPKNYFNVTDSAHVLVDNSSQSFYNPDIAERLRPEDIFSAMSRQTYQNIGTFVDERTAQGPIPVLSNRKNGIPTNYLSDIMEGYQNAIIDPTDSTGNASQHFSKARAFTASSSIQMDAFIKAISNVRQTPTTSVFTFADLVRLDQNTSNNTKYAKAGTPQINVQTNFSMGTAQPWDAPHQAGMTESWESPTQTTQAAVVLSNSVPALLMELALTGIHFQSTNRNLGTPVMGGNRITTTIGNWESFSDFDMSAHLRTFVNRFEREIMQGLTFNNQLDYWVEMRADLLGETWIKISLSGSPIVVFTQPSFADALAVPVLSNNRDAVSSIVDDFGLFLNAVIPADQYGMQHNDNFNII